MSDELSPPAEPTTREEWQNAADAAIALLKLNVAKTYGLVSGGPEVNAERCEELLERAAELGIRLPRRGGLARSDAPRPQEEEPPMTTADVVGGGEDHLQVRRDPESRCYLVRYLSGPSRARNLDLFGVDTLPLPWTAESPVEDVLADVRRRNPGATVEQAG